MALSGAAKFCELRTRILQSLRSGVSWVFLAHRSLTSKCSCGRAASCSVSRSRYDPNSRVTHDRNTFMTVRDAGGLPVGLIGSLNGNQSASGSTPVTGGMPPLDVLLNELGLISAIPASRWRRPLRRPTRRSSSSCSACGGIAREMRR